MDFIQKNTDGEHEIIFLTTCPFIRVGHLKNCIRDKLLRVITSFRNRKYLIIACHTLSSTILDLVLRHNNLLNGMKVFEPILPACMHIQKKKYKNILILSTAVTARVRWHARFLASNVTYITFDQLHAAIDNNDVNGIEKELKRLSARQNFISTCDCVLLGCTHFNIIKKTISKHLCQNHFKGTIVDSNRILKNYVKKSFFCSNF